jgi:hypothetical protein
MRRADPAVAIVALASGLAAFAGLEGGDLRWAAALGDAIVRLRHIPAGLPFSSARTASWPNVPVVSELVLGRMHHVFGDRGFVVAQVTAVALTFDLLRRAMVARGARPGGAALSLVLVFAGAFPAFVIIRLQLFSLAPFAVLIVVLTRPSQSRRALAALPVLFCVWSNLHGAVLVGLAVLGIYALAHLRTERMPILVAAGSAFAVCLTPALWRTPAYYYGVATSVAARRGVELWAPLSLHSGLDDVFLAAAVVLAGAAVAGGIQRWEAATSCLLALATVHTARTGVWLLMLVSIPAASGLSRLRARRLRSTAAVAATGLGASLVLAGLVRGPQQTAATSVLLHRARAAAVGTPIVAEGAIGEQLALAGATIWVGDPLDAYTRRDQRTYLDWADGKPSGDRALSHAPRVVVTSRRSSAAERLARNDRFRICGADAHAELFVRRAFACFRPDLR